MNLECCRIRIRDPKVVLYAAFGLKAQPAFDEPVVSVLVGPSNKEVQLLFRGMRSARAIGTFTLTELFSGVAILWRLRTPLLLFFMPSAGDCLPGHLGSRILKLANAGAPCP